MKRAFVDSTSIASVGYDERTRTLEVQFSDGEVYRYFNVPPVVHRDLLAADSIGQYLAYFIKPTYRCQKVEG